MLKRVITLGVFGFICGALTSFLLYFAVNISHSEQGNDALAFNSGVSTINSNFSNLDVTSFLFLPGTIFALFLTISIYYLLRNSLIKYNFFSEFFGNIIRINIVYGLVAIIVLFVELATCDSQGIGARCNNGNTSFLLSFGIGGIVAGFLLVIMFRNQGIMFNLLQAIGYILLCVCLIFSPFFFIHNTADEDALFKVIIVWETGMFAALGLLSSLREGKLNQT